MAFTPLSVRRGLQEPFVLVEGVPQHVEAAIWRLVDEFLFNPDLPEAEGRIDCLLAVLRWPVTDQDSYHQRVAIHRIAHENEDHYLDLLDFLCQLKGYIGDNFRRLLAPLLELAGSAWMVDPGREAGLERRVTDEAQAAFHDTIEPRDLASKHLARAWTEAFGRDHDAGVAWHSAVKAVEALLQPIVTPKDSKATLGKMISALRDKPAKWHFILNEPNGDGGGDGETFLHALRLISYEPDRHGTDDRTASIEQARAVVFQAVTIVEWLRIGALTPTASE